MLLYEMLDKRFTAYRELKRLLDEQQKALLFNDSEQVSVCAQQQVTCLENIQEIETSWKSWLESCRAKYEQPELSSEQAVFLEFDQEAYSYYKSIKENLLNLFQQIETLREENSALMANSLEYVQTMLKQIKNGIEEKGVYQPGNKRSSTSYLINKKL